MSVAQKTTSLKAAAANAGIAKRQSSVEKEALRNKMMTLNVACGFYSADRIFETKTFLGRLQNLQYRTMLLRDCSAKTAAEAVITQVETFIAKVNKTSAKKA